MGKYSYLKRATIDFADLYDKIKAEADAQGKSVNEYVKAAVGAFINGEIVQTSKLFAGEPSEACVYAIEGCQTCPLRKAHPELRKPENLLALKKFCSDCSINIYAKEKARAKARAEVKYPAVFKKLPDLEGEPEPAPAAAPVAVAIPVNQRPPSRITELPPNQALIACDSCNDRFIFDDIDHGLDDFTQHLKERHGGRDISGNEANQFRHARTRLERNVKAA